MSRVRLGLRSVVTMVFLLPLSGCLLSVLFPPPVNLPAALEFALANKSAIAEKSNDPLAPVEVGTVIDDLSTLDGCWASFSSIARPDKPTVSLDAYEVLVLDAAKGTLVRYSYQNLFGAATDAMVQTGTFEVADGGLIRFSVDRVDASNFGHIVDVTDHYDVPFVYSVRATLSGSSLKTLFDVEPADDPRTPAGFADDTAYVLVRIDCPT